MIHRDEQPPFARPVVDRIIGNPIGGQARLDDGSEAFAPAQSLLGQRIHGAFARNELNLRLIDDTHPAFAPSRELETRMKRPWYATSQVCSDVIRGGVASYGYGKRSE